MDRTPPPKSRYTRSVKEKAAGNTTKLEQQEMQEDLTELEVLTAALLIIVSSPKLQIRQYSIISMEISALPQLLIRYGLLHRASTSGR